ncbi:MAG: ankyrin repeat domain-containing protein [Candidatus Methylacidiphilales bacterium]|nr:ankyrin repeat domain-containing protein [Candidatus Methylacidiphilales bacterium]
MTAEATTTTQPDPILHTTPEEEQRYAELQHEAIHCARSGDNDAMLGAMLAAGMPVNLADAKGNTLLMLAAYHGNAETVELLLKAGADPDRRNSRGQTPLGGVAFKGYLPVAQLLVAAGADVNADQGGGTTAIMLAALFGRKEMQKFLAEKGADARARNKFGLSARVLAWFSGAFRLLLKTVMAIRALVLQIKATFKAAFRKKSTQPA